MAAMSSVSLLSVQARPARLFSQSRSSRPRSSTVVAVSKACKDNKVNTVAKQALALFAATQLLVAPIAGPALAVDAPDAKGALESIKDALPNPFFGRSDKVNQGPTDASSKVQESIKISQSGKANEADSLADKLNKGAPSTGVPDMSGVGKSLGTTDGGL